MIIGGSTFIRADQVASIQYDNAHILVTFINGKEVFIKNIDYASACRIIDKIEDAILPPTPPTH